MRRTRNRLPAILLAFLLIALLLPTTAFAAGKIDLTRPITLTIRYQKDGVDISGTQFDIYKIADVDEYARMTLTAVFSPYKDDITGLSALNDQDQDSWMLLASNLKVAVQHDSLSPDAAGSTDENGELALTDLHAGLYLVIGHVNALGDYIYTASPFMIFLPGADYESNTWVYDYDAIIEPKATKQFIPSEEDTVSRKVLKVWDDEGNEENRPSEITVSLLRDGEAVDTVTLNDSNSWRASWDSLSAKYEWSVAEKSVGKYTALIEQNGVTFVITNTYSPDEGEEDEDIYDPDTPFGEFEEEEEGEEDDLQYLPQTGLLWWPVPVMLCAGLVFLVLGITHRRREQ